MARNLIILFLICLFGSFLKEFPTKNDISVFVSDTIRVKVAVIQWLIRCRRCQKHRNISLEFNVYTEPQVWVSAARKCDKKERKARKRKKTVLKLPLPLLQCQIIFLSQCTFCSYFMMLLRTKNNIKTGHIHKQTIFVHCSGPCEAARREDER